MSKFDDYVAAQATKDSVPVVQHSQVAAHTDAQPGEGQGEIQGTEEAAEERMPQAAAIAGTGAKEDPVAEVNSHKALPVHHWALEF